MKGDLGNLRKWEPKPDDGKDSVLMVLRREFKPTNPNTHGKVYHYPVIGIPNELGRMMWSVPVIHRTFQPENVTWEHFCEWAEGLPHSRIDLWLATEFVLWSKRQLGEDHDGQGD